ncbi:MAG TPA: NfeD family protein, partial [Chthoniobacterales bacterium]
HIYMAPVSAIGAAAPVSGGGQEIPETMSAKIISYYSGYFRSAAEKNGYNPDIAEAFINKKKEVKIGDEVINPVDSLLTLSAQAAVKKYNGKPLLADGIADSVEALARQAGLGQAAVQKFEPSGFERIAFWITVFAPLFLAAGGLLAYLEFKSPGFGVAGVLSAVCFLLFFAGHYVAGLTGFEVMAVFVLGLLLVLVEVIFFPGVVFVSVLGLGLMLGSLFFAMVDFWPSRPLEFKVEQFSRAMIQFSIALVLTVFAGSLLARYFPSLPFFRRFLLTAASPGGGSIPVPVAALERRLPELGETGRAVSILRPSGRAVFGDDELDVMTDGEFIEPGAAVVLERREGAQLYVRRKR